VGRGYPGLRDVDDVLARLVDLVESARSLPMSASCVVNRAEVLGLLDDLRAGLPEALDEAQDVLADRTSVIDDGRREVDRLLADAEVERRRLLTGTDLVQDARGEADQVLEDAREQAAAMRAEAEDYVDAKLANFEIVLTRTLEAVERGRQKLSGRHELDALREGLHDDRPLPG